MVTTLYLVRHGETEGSEVKRYKGSIDVPLSEKGIQQMFAVSEFIKWHLEHSISVKHPNYLKDTHRAVAKPKTQNPKLDAVYCSPLDRALKSAEIIAEPYGLTPVVIPDLRERSFGIWEGMSFTEIKEKYPDEFEAWANNPLKYSPIKGESTIEVRDRVIPALNGILKKHRRQKTEHKIQNADTSTHPSPLKGEGKNLAPDFRPLSAENIAIVAHGGVNRIILCHVMGIPLKNIFRIEQNFASVNIIEFWEEKYPVVKALNLATHKEEGRKYWQGGFGG